MQEVIEAVFERWKTTMGHTRARLDNDRAKAIRAMLVAGYSQEDLELAIFGCSISAFHQGQNDRATVYDDISLICRNATNVDKFIKLAEKAATKATKQAMEQPRLMAKPASAVPEALRKYVKT